MPNEPSFRLAAAERGLTARHLLPALDELEAFLLAIRLELDPELEQQKPEKLGKPYPLGQCLEIALAVEKRLRTVDGRALPARVAKGWRAFKDFLRAGGSFRQVWGDLRGQYFQNAFQLGSLYVDVANDTVVPTKPKVDLLPFEEANFGPVRNFEQFRQLATTYWQNEVYPNHVLPELAPHCPLVHVNPQGRIMVHEATQYMLAMTRSQAFALSERVLSEPSMPPRVFEQVRTAVGSADHRMPRDPADGRRLALQQCRTDRARRRHRHGAIVGHVITRVQAINQQLTCWCHANPLEETPMPAIKIDNVEYELDTLSAVAKAQLQSIQFVDQELARMQGQMAALQTARNAYVKALKEALPPPLEGDTLKLA